MTKRSQVLRTTVIKGLTSLVETPAFSSWFRDQVTNARDLIVVNNSFIFRKPLISTSKNSQFLCMKVKKGSPDTTDPLVTEPGDFNADFKLFSAKSGNLPVTQLLDQGLVEEITKLGRLLFVLIGDLEDSPAAAPVNHREIKELRFEPSSRTGPRLQNDSSGKKIIVVNQLMDPESSWNGVRRELEQVLGSELSSVEAAFASSFEKLQDEVRLRLLLPGRTTRKTTTSFVGRLRESVSEQRRLYEAALNRAAGGAPTGDRDVRDVMRIAYNFAEDAIKVLQLLVSIADLKAILLWCSVREHFDVAEAFRNLPWTRSHKKPSLERYREIVGGARNRAFHNLLAFDRTIEADLAGVQVNARRLTILPAHGRRRNVIPFDYEDREMVEILTDLTRAPETTVPFEFWRKNAAVIQSFERLLVSTENTLWALNRARQ